MDYKITLKKKYIHTYTNTLFSSLKDNASHIKVGIKSNENELQQWYLEPYYQAEQEE